MRLLPSYELSFVFSFFLKENRILSINSRYFNFFITNYSLQSNFINLVDELKTETSNFNTSLNLSKLENVSLEEYNFCLSQLSKTLSNKEKFCTLLLLLDLCHDNQIYEKKRLAFLELTAKMLVIDSSWFQALKQFSFIINQHCEDYTFREKLYFIHESDLIDQLELKTQFNKADATPIALGYIFLPEERLAFVRVFNKSTQLNGRSVELNKIYPLNEGDVLNIKNYHLSFDQLFRYHNKLSKLSALIISSTEDTPRVHFDPFENKMEISGCSIPEDGFTFFSPLLKWIDNYLLTLPKQVEVKIHLHYFNTTSSKFILDIFKRFENFKSEKIDVKINWYFQSDDVDLEEAGLNYSEIVNVPFILIPY